jgi:predicted Zn-dependent protease
LRVALVPFGEVPDADLDVVKKALQDYYQVRVTVMAPLAVPGDARLSVSTQSIRLQAGGSRVVADTGVLQAGPLLSLLAGYQWQGFDKVVGVTPRGIRTGREGWTIRGVANGACAVVSTYLIRQQSAAAEFAFCLAKVARHEFGHILDLPHCGELLPGAVPILPQAGTGDALANGNPNCFMLGSTPDGTQFYATTNRLCDACAGQVRNHLRARLSP